ncbi:LysR family transcriptional regulator [Microvirga puerhi]|uniref:LysR family transcriptional regulator n=1 Tax=Microvirga puerhi TaxID=2876078 RepID=A0ABS7VK47_9HYPH|nr:LysR family transcriptional regulator [Microvirga puerhi]MBZ6075541.1 LysR family transcriptional regulator [Microvirga puerhi]
MARLDINRSGEMEVFVRAVEQSGFSAAARSLRMTPSAVSKLVARLEARLGARLVHRSTRRLQLTPEGVAFFERAKRILAEIDDAEREASFGAAPKGRVRVNSNVPFGLHHLLPLVPGFLDRYPDVRLDIVLTDQVVDLFEERADVAIRVGPLRTSQLVARKLGTSRMVVVAAPSYLSRHGTPKTPTDLEAHNRIGFNFARSFDEWPFKENDAVRTLPAVGNALAGDGETSRRMALAGVGLARLAWFHIGPDIAAGRLVPMLEAFNPGDSEDIHAVFVGQGGRLPARVRAFIDYLAETVKLPYDGAAG